MAKSIWGALGGALATVAGAAAKNAANKVNQTNKGTGTTAPSSLAGGGKTTYYPSYSAGTPTDQQGNVDYAALFEQKKNAGASYDELNRIAQDRAYKAQTKQGYGGYSGDATQKAMDAYLSGIAQPQYNFDFSEMQDRYDEVSAAEQAAIDAYIRQTVNGLESQKSGVNQSADEAARQAYISYMKSQDTLPQALAANGYSGGMADSQRLALDTNLQNNQKDILVNRDNTLSGIDTAIQNARLEGSIQGAQSQAQLGRDAIGAYQDYVNQKNAYSNQDFWSKYGYNFNANQSTAGREWQSGEAQKDRDDNNTTTTQQKAHDDAWNLIMNGVMPGMDLLGAAGITVSDAQNYVNAIKAKKSAGGTGADVSKTPTNKTVSQAQYDTAAQRYMNGDYSEDVISLLLNAGEKPAALASAVGFGDETSLGYGPIGNNALAQKLESGEVEALNIGGTLYYRKTGKQGGIGALAPGFTL